MSIWWQHQPEQGAPPNAGVLKAAMSKLWAAARETPRDDLVMVADPYYFATLKAALARGDAIDLWRAKGADWRRLKREGNRAFRASMRASR